jgi:hypothetical protein
MLDIVNIDKIVNDYHLAKKKEMSEKVVISHEGTWQKPGLNQNKPEFFINPRPVQVHHPTRPNSCQNGKHPARTARRDEGGRRRTTNTKFDQRMDELLISSFAPSMGMGSYDR